MHSAAQRIFLLLALFFLLGQAAAAASLVPVARIVRAEGEVTVRYAGTDEFVSVWRHEKVGPRDTVCTGPDGLVEMELPDGSLLVLGSGGSLVVETIEPAWVTDEQTGDKRIVITARLRLTAGRMRAAVGPGSLVLLTAGWASAATDPATGADVTVAADVFSSGYYLRAARGCVFVLLRGSEVLPVCGDSRVRVEMFADRLTPLLLPDPYTESITLTLTGVPPAIAPQEKAVTRVTINGKKVEGKDGTFHIDRKLTGTAGTATVEGTVTRGWAALVSVDNGVNWVTIAPDQDGGWRYGLGPVPAGGYTLRAKAMYVGAPPLDIAAMAEGPLPPPTEGTTAAEKEKVDPEAVASRFVQAFSGALSRGDTGALARLVSPDYNGVAGGAGRSALLAGVSEFFRAGGTLAVSAYATGASLTKDTVIVTMSFSSRVNGTAKSGNLRLWLTADGMLTHSEGRWVF